MKTRNHFIASVAALVVMVIILMPRPREVAVYSLVLMTGLLPDMDKIPHPSRYHRNWLMHSTIPFISCWIVFGDVIFVVAGVLVGLHLLMDIGRGRPGGTYCIVKPSGKRMDSIHSTAWLVLNGIAPLAAFIVIAIPNFLQGI